MTSKTPTYNPKDYQDKLFPEGRPPCHICGIRPVYLAGKCGDCYAAAKPPK